VTAARLVSIELEAFRGFADAHTIDLDADVVLVHGDNGSGKTSLVDGLLWGLTGELPRLNERAKGLRRGQDPIVNAYTDGPARVRISVVDAEGRALDFERRGTSSQHALLAWSGEESLPGEETLARAFGDLSFEQLAEGVRTWGILQQHAVSTALDSGATLHERLSSVIGLERVTRFAESADRTVKDLRWEVRRLQRVHADLSGRHSRVKVSLEETRDALANAHAAREHLEQAISQACEASPENITAQIASATPENVMEFSRSLATLASLAGNLASRHANLIAAEKVTAPTVDDAQAEMARLMRQADVAVRDAPLQIQLASAAIELLGDACPVCDQNIEEAHVRAHLTQLLEHSQHAIKTAAATRDAISHAQSSLLRAQAAQKQRADALTEQEHAAVRLRQGLQRESAALSVDEVWAEPAKAAELAKALSQLGEQMSEIGAQCQRDHGGWAERLSIETDSLAQEMARTELDVRDAEGRRTRAEALAKAAKRAAERILHRAIKGLEPSFAEVFDRLAPHSAFTELHAEQDIFYGKNQIVPKVLDTDRGVTANPELIFSEGQLNIVALSYFLGLALNAREGALPFLVLDDPLQAVDILGVLGFADLCRRLREHRQLVLTTHDRRFASLLERKLAPRQGSRTVLHEFGGWTREGPQITSRTEPLAEIVPLLGRRAA
jgi:DNA repair exonuclease SbcCD ATPase subunit